MDHKIFFPPKNGVQGLFQKIQNEEKTSHQRTAFLTTVTGVLFSILIFTNFLGDESQKNNEIFILLQADAANSLNFLKASNWKESAMVISDADLAAVNVASEKTKFFWIMR